MSGAPDPGWNDDDLAKLRTVPGSAFEAVDVARLETSPTSYAVAGASTSTTTTSTTLAPSTTTTSTTVPASGELVANPGFEANLTGWTTGNGTTLARVCTVSHTGACSAQLGRKSNTGDAVLDDSPNSVASSTAGGVYGGSAWVDAPAGRSVTLPIREDRGSKLVRARTSTVSGTGGWQQVTVQSAPADGGTSISIDVSVYLATSTRAQVDDVSLRKL